MLIDGSITHLISQSINQSMVMCTCLVRMITLVLLHIKNVFPKSTTANTFIKERKSNETKIKYKILL